MSVNFVFNVNRVLPMNLDYTYNGANLLGNKAQGLSVPILTSAWYNSVDMDKYNYYLVLRSIFQVSSIEDDLETEMKGKNLGYLSPNFPQFNTFNNVESADLPNTNTILYIANTESEFESGAEEPEPIYHAAKHNYAFSKPVLLNENTGMAFFNRGYRLQVDIYDFSRGDYLILNPAGTDRTISLMMNFSIFECQKF
jgi:hypothetical protein